MSGWGFGLKKYGMFNDLNGHLGCLSNEECYEYGLVCIGASGTQEKYCCRF
jgi:hypothetical protein